MDKRNKKPYSKGRGDRSNHSQRSRRDDMDRTSTKEVKASANDPKWYSSNGQLLKDTASFSYERRTGTPIELNIGSGYGSVTSVDPGIMSIYTVPTIGVSDSNTAAVNLAMRDVYSYVRHTNSGHANYDPVDLMLYMLAMDSVYTYWSYMTRIYGLMGTYSKTNRYVGDALLQACGVKPDDLRANYAQFRAYINQFAIEASRYAVPAIFSLFIRHSWMYSNVYRDEDVGRSQFYVYVPACIYQYAVKPGGAGYLVNTRVAIDDLGAPSLMSFENIKSLGNALLQDLATQEDIGIISGDILKAYGEDKLWKLSQIDDTYNVFPIFSEEVLMQIHNTDFVGVEPGFLTQSGTTYTFTKDWSALDITQNTSVSNGGFLEFKPYFNRSVVAAMSKVLDFWKEDITPEMSMVASRNKVMSKVAVPSGATTTNGARVTQVTACGSELCLCAAIWYFDSDTDHTYRYLPYWQHDSSNYTYTDIAMYMKFNEAPIRPLFNPNNARFAELLGEFSKFTVLDGNEISRLHDCALLSMFNIVGP